MNIGKLTIEMAANVARLQKDLAQGVRSVDSATAKIGEMAGKAKSALGGIAAGLTVAATIRKLVDVQRQFDILNSSLVTVTGSSAAAAKEFKWIKTFAATTPYALNEVTQAFVKMKALGLDASQAALTSYGNTASAMGKNLNQMIEAVADAATGEFERLKEFGIKARKNGDDVALTFQGITTTVKNNAAEITGYLQALGENQFAGAMARRAETLDGAISNLGDTWEELFRTVNDNATGSIITDSVRLATSAIQDAILIINAMGDASKNAATDVGALSAVQNGLAKVFETVAVLGVNVKYVLVQVGRELGGIAAQAAAFLSGNWAEAAAIGRAMKEDAAQARREVDAQTAAILNARRLRDIAAKGEGEDEPRFRRLLEGQTTATKAATVATVAKTVSTNAARKAESALAAQRKRDAAEAKRLHDEEQAELQKRIDAYADEVELREAAVASVQASAAAEREANEEIGLSATAVTELHAARLLDAAAEQDRRAVMMDGIDPVVAKTYRDQADALRELAAARNEGAKKRATLEAAKDAQKAAEAATKATALEWEKTADQISQALTDALMTGFMNGEGFAENLGNSVKSMFKTWVAKAIADAIKNAILSAMATTQWGNLIGGLVSGGGGSGNSVMGIANQANNASSLYSGYNTLANGAGSNWGAAGGWATGSMSTANAVGSIAANAATTGTATTSIAASGAGIDALLATNAAYGTATGAAAGGTAAAAGGTAAAAGGTAAAAGGTAAAAGGTAAAGGATAALSAIPYWGWIAIALIALWKPMFGRKLTDIGTKVNFDGAGGITTNDYTKQKGGWFRSDKNTTGADTTEQNSGIIQMAKNVQEGAANMARAMGYSDEAIRSYTGSLNINMKGAKTAEEQTARVTKAMDDLRYQMFTAVPGLEMTREKFDEFMNGVREAVEAAGIGATALTDIIVQGMTGRMTESQVGEALATTVLGGIYNTIASPFAAQIANAFSTQIIEPVMAAALAGVPIAQAVSSAAVANVVETARNAANALQAIFADEGFQAAIKQIYDAVGQVSRISVKPARALPSFNAALVNTTNAADEAARALEEEQARLKAIKDAWTDVTDSLIEEIRRIRGEMGTDNQNLAYYQAQFAIKYAQAGAGDIDAAKELPALSQSILDIGRLTATSAVDMRLMEATMISQLESLRQAIGGAQGIDLPAFATGTNYVSRDMAAIIHKGEAIVPAQYNPENGGSVSAGEVAAQFAMYNAKLDALINASVQTVVNTGGTKRMLDRVVREDYIQTKVAA